LAARLKKKKKGYIFPLALEGNPVIPP